MNYSELYIKYRMIIWPVIVGVSSVMILALVIIPQLLTYLNIKDQINQAKNKSQNLEAKANELVSINDILTKKDLKVVFSILPTDQDVPKAMTILQDIISKSGLKLKSTSFGYSGQNSNKNSFQLNVIVSGQINLLRSLLIELQNASRIFQVESIGVKFQKNQEAVEAMIPISVFYQAELGKIGSPNQPILKINDIEKELLSKLYQYVGQSDKLSENTEASSSSIPLGKIDPFE